MNKNKKIKTVVYARVSTKDAKPSSSALLETLIKNGMAQHYSLQKGIQIRAGIRAKKLRENADKLSKDEMITRRVKDTN